MSTTEQVLSLNATSGERSVDLGTAGDLYVGGGTRFIEMWFRPATIEAMPLFGIGHEAANKADRRAFGAYLTSEGKLAVRVHGAAVELTTLAVLEAGRWYHVQISIPAGGLGTQIRLNGMLVGREGPPSPTDELQWESADRIKLGTSLVAPDGTYFKGDITEVRLWSGAINQDKLAYMFRRLTGEEPGLRAYFPLDGRGADSPTVARNARVPMDAATGLPDGTQAPAGTIAGGAFVQSDLNLHRPSVWTVEPPSVVVADFPPEANGSIAVSEAEALKITRSMTVEVWARYSGTGEWGTHQLLSMASPTAGWSLFAVRNECGFSVVIDGTLRSIRGEVTAPASTWVHIAAVHDHGAKTIRLFLNGMLVADTKLPDSVAGDISVAAAPLHIGQHSYLPGTRFTGQAAELRIWNVARTQAEIRQAMWSRLAAQTGLVALYRLEGDTDDRSGYAHHGNAAGVQWAGASVPLPASSEETRRLALVNDRLKRLPALPGENASLTNENTDLASSIAGKEDDLDQASTAIRDRSAEVERITTALDALRKEVKTLRAAEEDLESTQAAIEGRENDIDEILTRKEITSLDDFVGRVNQEISSARRSIAETTGDYYLGRVTMEVKMLPEEAGASIRFPAFHEIKALDTSVLSTLSVDFEASDPGKDTLPQVTVPSVIGYTGVLARRKLTEMGLGMDTSYQAVNERAGAAVQADRVVSQLPRPGEAVPAGTTITLFIGRES